MNESEVRQIAASEVGKLALFVILLFWLFCWFTAMHHERIKKLETAIEVINQPKEKE